MKQHFSNEIYGRNGTLYELSESSGLGGTMCAGISISAVWGLTSVRKLSLGKTEYKPLSDRLPFKYSGVSIVSNTFKSFSVMCK